MSLSFAHLWQQDETSDMDVILLAPAEASDQQEQQADSGTPATFELMSFPAHRTLLSNSAVLWCRVLRWQDANPSTRAAKRPRHSSSGNDGPEQPARARLELELQDDSEQEAALAVLSSLYAVKPLPELLSELSQEQQLQAALLADKWQVPNVSSAAAQLLVAAANTPGALAEGVRHRVLAAAALPDCLQPLQQSVLLSLLGDLEAVWADAGLRERLLGLPLHSMELLLSRTELKVASEDTVLYTAQQYINQLAEQQQAHARQRLAPLIRCPHLSRYWLAASVTSAADTMLLAELRPHLRHLLILGEAKPGYTVDGTDVREGGLLAGAPASWAMGRRVSKPVSSVQLLWRLDVSALRNSAHRCAAEQQTISMLCPDTSPPLGGIGFTMKLYCRFQDGGVQIGLYGRAQSLPKDMYYMCSIGIGLDEFAEPPGCPVPKPIFGSAMRGTRDVFSLEPMAGGWDEAAWAAKGLPTSGQLTIKLIVSDLPHAVVPAPRFPGRGRGRGRGRW